MTRWLSAVVAVTAFLLATLALLPGVATAQTGSPPPVTAAPIVAGVVVTTTPAPVVGGVVVTTAPAQVVRRQPLPRTGSDLVPMIGTALGLMVLGVLLVISVRRRRTTEVRLA